MTISFVGAGNLASHLAPVLAQAGHSILSIFSRTIESASLLAERVGQGSSVTTNLETISTADIYIISVRDDALPEVISHWPKHCRQGIVLHTAGTIAMDVLAPISEHYGVLYPMQTFSKDKALTFCDIPCFIESNDTHTVEILKQLALSVTPKVQHLSSDERRKLHLAAVFACNFSNHMVALAHELLTPLGIDPACLLPLIDETAQKLHHLSPHDAQTGPARRADATVMQAHFDALTDNPELQHIYKILSDSILRRYTP